MKAKTLFSMIATVCAVTSVQAGQVSLNLFNTGVDAAHTVLTNGTLGDTHYTLTSVPGGSSVVTRVISAANGFPVGPWIGDNGLSAWISPNNVTPTAPTNHDLDSPAGSYTYRTTFDLTGMFPWTAQISGLWSTDNNGVDILINGMSLGATTAPLQFGIGGVAFAVNSGFVAGINTLDFVVNNTDGPTGLRVELTGSAHLAPEPGSLALLGVALAGMALSRRQRR